jgi:hypothetical protein
MKVILWNDGRCYAGRTPEEIVDAMRRDSIWTVGKDLDEYMRGVARRLRAVSKVRVNYADASAFLAGLEHAGLIRQESMQ